VKYLEYNLQGYYLNLPPPISLILLELSDSCLPTYPTPNLAARMPFFYLKKAFKIEKKNVKTRKIANIWKMAGSTAKPSKFQLLTLLLGVLQGMVIGFKLYRKSV